MAPHLILENIFDVELKWGKMIVNAQQWVKPSSITSHDVVKKRKTRPALPPSQPLRKPKWVWQTTKTEMQTDALEMQTDALDEKQWGAFLIHFPLFVSHK